MLNYISYSQKTGKSLKGRVVSMKKRVLAALITAAIVMAMTGCGNNSAKTESAAAATTQEAQAETAAAEEWMNEGKDVILEIEVQGCQKIKEKDPECVSIFIMPPSMEVLEKRLRGRGTETEEVIIKRLARAREEIELAKDYDYIVVNGPIEECVADVLSVINAEKLRAKRFDKTI